MFDPVNVLQYVNFYCMRNRCTEMCVFSSILMYYATENRRTNAVSLKERCTSYCSVPRLLFFYLVALKEDTLVSYFIKLVCSFFVQICGAAPVNFHSTVARYQGQYMHP